LDIHTTSLINSSLAWILVVVAIVGYIVTLRRKGEKLTFWLLLAAGWLCFAVSFTLLSIDARVGTLDLVAGIVASYILIMASLIILFMRLVRVKAQRVPSADDDSPKR
jgi:hypothetical protein